VLSASFFSIAVWISCFLGEGSVIRFYSLFSTLHKMTHSVKLKSTGIILAQLLHSRDRCGLSQLVGLRVSVIFARNYGES
jgi:multisubunit Na+/H+ antiporter MnhG subunit